MKLTQERLLFLGSLLVLGLLAFTINQWLPALIEFINPNAQLIQSLASLIQIAIWAGILLLFLSSLYFGERSNTSKFRKNAQKEDDKSDEQALATRAKQSSTYSVNARTIHSLTQGDNNQTIMNFNQPPSQPKDE